MKKNKKFIKFLYSLFKSIMTLIIIALIIVIVVQRISNNKISVAGFRIFNVATESMIPKYLVGDILIVKTVDVSTIKVGDDITYQGEKESFAGKVVTHQVIDIEIEADGSKKYHTKGIANDQEDPTINENQIYGVVVGKLVFLTYISKILNDMKIMYAILVVSVGVVMFLDIKDLKKEEKEELEKIDEESKEKPSEKKNKKVNRMRERRKKRKNKNKYKD